MVWACLTFSEEASLQSCMKQKLNIVVTSQKAASTQGPRFSLQSAQFNTATAVSVTLNPA